MKTSLSFRSMFVAIVLCLLQPALGRAGEDSGWYLKPELGVSLLQDINTTTTFLGVTSNSKASFDPGVRFDLAGGYQFDQSWTAEVSLGFTYNSVKITGGGPPDSDSLYQVPLLINGIYTLPLKSRFKPYVGLGLGLVLTGQDSLGRDIGGAAQFMTGVKYEVSKRVDVSLGYKLMVTTTHDWLVIFGDSRSSSAISHSIMASVTFRF